MTDLGLLPPSARIEGEDLLVGGCSLRELAGRFGTPAFIMDEGALRAQARAYLSAITGQGIPGRVCFAVKSFPSISMMRVMVSEGLGCDVVGAGELRMALLAGADPAKIVMHGNAKSDEDIGAALEARIGYIVVDGFDEIDRIAKLASEPAPVLLRVVPGVESDTHAALATGGERSKFGVPVEAVPEAIARMRAAGNSDLRGVHAHIGSQILNVSQFEDAVAALASLERFGVYDFGGGLGVRYEPGDIAPSVAEYAERLIGTARRHLGDDIEVLVEPGRSRGARAGLTLYRVVTTKRSGKLHVAVDGGMGDNLEPSLYGQRFTPLVVGRWDAEPVTADLVGRHCESGDVITPDVPLADPRIGDLVVVAVTGAYCFTMCNNYNAALKPPVIYCQDGVARVGVRRETFGEMIAREVTIE